MILGIAARISTRKLTTVLRVFPAISDKNIATPKLIGKEIINAIMEDTTVP